MNGLPRSISLQHEAARPPWIIRVIFNQYGLSQSLDDITYPDLVRGELIVAVNRNLYVEALAQRQDVFEGSTIHDNKLS